jgi:hypothetical protein
MMRRETIRTARVEARVSPEVLAVVKRAAELQGRSVSDFVVDAARTIASEGSACSSPDGAGGQAGSATRASSPTASGHSSSRVRSVRASADRPGRFEDRAVVPTIRGPLVGPDRHDPDPVMMTSAIVIAP